MTYLTTIEFMPDNEGGDRGWLCLCWASPQFDDPIMDRSYYPIVYCGREDYDPYLGKDAKSYSPGVYAVYGVGFSPKYFRLVNGGETLPIKTISSPIPPPKRAKEVRYWLGRWEKYTKSNGWQVAY